MLLPSSHQNYFYEQEGSTPHNRPEYANWVMRKDTHSLPDGILHPAMPAHRNFLVNEEGEGVHLPLDLASGDGVLLPEFFFRKGRAVKEDEDQLRHNDSYVGVHWVFVCPP